MRQVSGWTGAELEEALAEQTICSCCRRIRSTTLVHAWPLRPADLAADAFFLGNRVAVAEVSFGFVLAREVRCALDHLHSALGADAIAAARGRDRKPPVEERAHQIGARRNFERRAGFLEPNQGHDSV